MVLTLRTWLRYLVPLTMLALVACLPLLYVAFKTAAPADVPSARAQVRLAWVLAAGACVCQLLLVAGVAPAVRSVASGTPIPQWRALAVGLGSLARGVVPWLVAIVAVLLGGVALVVPGLLLLVLFSLTGASEQLGAPLPGPLADSIAVARAQLPRVALVIGAIVLVDLAIVYAGQLAYVPVVGKKSPAAKLLPIRTFVRVTVLALVTVSPLVACGLASLYSHAKRR